MFAYAEIDEAGYCFHVFETLTEQETTANILALPTYDESYARRTYDRASQTWSEPPPVPVVRHITVGAFFDRFGDQKYPILASTEAGVRALIMDCQVRRFIDLDNPQLPAGLALLQGVGFAIDAEAILTAQIQPGELP